MNKQRKVLITVTYNEMGIIIDTKAEEVAQPNLQQTCNQLATNDIDIQETDGVYEHCDDCIHEADSIDICILRQRKHAIAELKECYEPKQPDRKQGKWIFQGNRSKTLYGWYFCSECGAYIGGKCNFCSECGADMREVREDE